MIMKRKLIIQMLNEWRPNVWLVVELVIVICVLHFLFNSLYGIYLSHSSNKGFDFENVYYAEVSTLKNNEDVFFFERKRLHQNDCDMLIAKLKSNPYVEDVIGSLADRMPYSYSSMNSSISLYSNGGTNVSKYDVGIVYLSPDIVRFLKMTGVNGETTEELAEIIERRDVIISDRDVYKDPDELRAKDLLGKEVYFGNDSLRTTRVGAVAYGMRMGGDYIPTGRRICYKNVESPWDWIDYIFIRVKPGMGHKFVESLTMKDMRAGNSYLEFITSFKDEQHRVNFEANQRIRNNIIFSVFVLMVIFLGFLGSFWFRTQQRVSEIAIRKVSGATNLSIYSRFYGEGLILLCISAVIALPLIYWLSHTEMLSEWVSGNLSAALVSMAWTVGILALLIVAGIYVPARKATQIEPANAIKEL